MILTPGQEVLAISFAASFVLTFAICSLLSRTQKSGTVIRDQGPAHHKAKAKIESTGGRAFLITFAVVGFPAALLLYDAKAILGVAAGLLSGLIGLADDILKVTRKDSSGLKARYKLPLQILVGLLVASATDYLLEETGTAVPFLSSNVELGAYKLILGLFTYLLIVNAVNFTDGIDGLASSTVFIAAFFLGTALWLTGKSSAAVPVILMGTCAGFLPINWNPAKLFMGDAGSLCLGGALAATAVAAGLELPLMLIGLVFLIEAGSVILQVVYFRLTGGKRIFLMTPYHHALELRGFKEPKIVIVFSVIGFLAGIVGILSVWQL